MSNNSKPEGKKTPKEPKESKALTPTPETEKKKEEPKEKAAKSKQKGSGFALLIAFLALLLAGGAGGASYYLWQQILLGGEKQQEDFSAQQSELRQLDSRISQRIEQLDPRFSALRNEIQQLRGTDEEARQQLHELDQKQQTLMEATLNTYELANRGQRGWILAEVDYLLRTANQRLLIARDINSAVAALSAADMRLHDLADLTLLDLRNQIADEIGGLKSVRQLDVTGMSMALDQMIAHVDSLPFLPLKKEVEKQLGEEAQEKAEEEPGALDKVLDKIKQLGNIKLHNRAVEPMTTPEEQGYLDHILRLRLEAGRLALLRFDQKNFSHELEEALKLLESFYDQQDNRIIQAQDDLRRFMQTTLKPELPDITKSWSMLQEVMNRPTLETLEAQRVESSPEPAAEKSGREAVEAEPLKAEDN